jgi:ATP-binding cassette subfamily B protein IrtB
VVTSLFSPDPGTAWPWVGLLVLVGVVGWLVDARTAAAGTDLGFTALEVGEVDIADRISEIRMSWFTSANTAAARRSIAGTAHELVGLFVYLFVPVIGALLLPVVIALALIPIAWQLELAALIGLPLLLGTLWLSGRLTRTADREASRANGILAERVIEFARTQQALRAARRAEPARSEAGAALASQHSATLRLLLLQVPGQVLFTLATQIALVLLAGVTVRLTVDGTIAVPAAIALIVVMVRYLESFTTLSELSAGIESTATVMADLRTVLEAPVEDTAADGGAAMTSAAANGNPGRAPRIELRQVSFAYDPAHPVLTDLDLTLEAGSTTAIVGPSGSGKSTVLDLLAGLQRPGSGHLLFDGVEQTDLSPATQREGVSMVFQDPFLFTGSIRENVLVGEPSADADRLREVADLARLAPVLERSRAGWDAPVGEAGSGLSGGERQRVSIARALLRPAPVLLVDEATSALDTENERAVSAALDDDATERTRVIVAHRLSSIRAADRILFLEEGRIVEDGCLDDLLAAEGRFAEFWRHQSATGAWRIAVP